MTSRVWGWGWAVHLAAAVVLLSALGCGGDVGSSESENLAQYPEHAIEMISWATAGGPTDLLARALAKVGPRHFGQRMTVSTREGGAGAVAMQYMAGKRGDGHVLGVFTASGAVNMATGRIGFGPEDLTFLMRVQLDPFLVAVPTASPFSDLAAFFAAARERPGELSVSGFGAASAHFLGFARLKAAAGDPDVRWIPFEGSADAVVAALGGHTTAVHTNYDIVREHVRAGTMKVLGVAVALPMLPGVPTYAEQGFDVAPVHWRGVVGPPGISAELAAMMRRLLEETVQDPEFAEYMEQAGMEYAVMESPEAFRTWVESEVSTSRTLLRELGLLQPER